MDDSTARPLEAAAPSGAAAPEAEQTDWTWPPFAPLEDAGTARFQTEEWAPASTVRRPLLRIGRWTLLYRRAAPAT